MGRPVKDIDLVLKGGAHPASLSEAASFASELARTTGAHLKRHDRFATANLTFPRGISMDVAMARRETYAHSGALPRVEPARSIDEDLRRRDFTIHAMAVEIGPGLRARLHDPLGGRSDLARRRLVVLHPRSFQDDPTRAFRMARYANRLGFTVERKTRRWLAQAIKEGSFRRVSGQRLRRELELLFSEPKPAGAVRWLARLGLVETLEPSLRADAGAVRRIRELERISQRRGDRPGWFVYLLVWAAGISPEAARALAERLALPGAEARALASWPATLTRLLGSRPLRPSAVADLQLTDEEKAAASAILTGRSRRAFARALRRGGLTLRIGGGDLLLAGVGPGPDIGRALARTLAARRDGRISVSEELDFALNVTRKRTQ